MEDNLLMLITLFQRSHFIGDSLYCMYVDLAKAYDSVDRARMWDVFLHGLSLSPDLICSL